MLKKWMLAGLIVVLLAACGEDETDKKTQPRDNEQPDATIVLTLVSLPEQTILPGCPSNDLEDWFENAYFTMQSFATEADEQRKLVDNDDRDPALETLSRLLSLRNVVAMTATPSCVEISSQQVLSAMQGVIDGFQRFTSGEIDKADLGEQVSPYITSLNGLLVDLQAVVDPLYKLTPSSSSDSTSAPE
ncbi:MAG: hypothetical protein HY862_07275 [Chloroflexi bacterium]|nr:hypothetical protein [Chloroflexota bacterium]